jgi:hypothetical protein
VVLIDRLNELRRQTRDADKWLWQLWLDGSKVEIRSWVKKHIDGLQPKLNGPLNARSLRSPIGRLVSNPVRRERDRDDFMRAWLGVAAGMAQLAGVYSTAEPPIFDIMLKVIGLPSTVTPPDRDLRRELSEMGLSFGGLSEIVADASDDDFEQARRDWRLIAGFIDGAERIDWTAATAAWESRIKSLTGAARASFHTRP